MTDHGTLIPQISPVRKVKGSAVKDSVHIILVCQVGIIKRWVAVENL